MTQKYIPTKWVANETIGTANVMNNIEQGIVDAYDEIERVNSQLAHIENKSFVSITDFGGVGDNITDNYDAFVNAVKYCKENKVKTIYIPDGVFIVSTNSKIVIDYDKLTIVGNSKTSTSVVFRSSSGGFSFEKPDNATFYKISFKNIQISGDRVCENLFSSNSAHEEMIFYDVGLSHAKNSVFNMKAINLSTFTQCDITNNNIAFNDVGLGFSVFDKCNIFSNKYVFFNGFGGQSMVANNCYFENNEKLYYSLDSIAFETLKYNNCRFLVNNGEEEMIYFIGDISIQSLVFNNCNFIFTNKVRTMIRFVSPQQKSQKNIKFIDSIIFNSDFDVIINNNLESYKHVTKLCLIDTFSLNKRDVDELGGNNLYITGISCGISTSTTQTGIKLGQNLVYEGRLYYNKDKKRIQVTNHLDVGETIPKILISSTQNRDSLGVQVGEYYFDTTIQKPVWNVGGAWKTANGDTV